MGRESFRDARGSPACARNWRKDIERVWKDEDEFGYCYPSLKGEKHMKTVITTTGISLYGNTKRSLEKQNPGKNLQPTEEQMRQYLRQEPEVASAEANSLLKMAEPGDSLVFLATATPQTQLCTNLLKSFFMSRGFHDVNIVNLLFQDREEHIEKQGIRSLISVL